MFRKTCRICINKPIVDELAILKIIYLKTTQFVIYAIVVNIFHCFYKNIDYCR